ncbi:MAG: TRAP transporter substrate-binding protein [Hyphomicrobiaceae bacterium]
MNGKGLMAAVVAGIAAISLTATGAMAQKRVKWKLQSAFGSNLPHLGPSALRFIDDVSAMSDGRFQIKFHEPGALVPALECFDAVSKGAIEACWTTPGYHTGKYPAAAFFTTVPFGPQIGEFLAWKWYGNGNKFRDEIYSKHGLVAFDSLCIGPETSGWFKKEYKSVDELKGIKMRFFGLGAKVMQKLGVSTQLLAGADIYPALERGVIDATEFSMPMMDIKLGFYQVAKYNYFPGWHQQSSCSEILMNKKIYEALPKTYQRMIKVAATAQTIQTYAETEASQFDQMAAMRDKYGVKIERWTDDDLAKMEQAWLDVIKEESAKDPYFKKVADDYLAYRDKYRVWGAAQSMKSTYLKK